MIIRSTRKRHRIKHKHARGAERLRGDGVFLALQQHTANEQGDADDEPDRHPQFRRDEIVLERILHEKSHPEKKRQPANPREKFRPHELLPINRPFDRNHGL